MHHSGPLRQNFEGPEQGFVGKNCQNASRGENPVTGHLFCPFMPSMSTYRIIYSRIPDIP